MTPAASGSVIRRMRPCTPLGPHTHPSLRRLNLLPQQPPLTHVAKGLWQPRDQPDGLSSPCRDLRTLVAAHTVLVLVPRLGTRSNETIKWELGES